MDSAVSAPGRGSAPLAGRELVKISTLSPGPGGNKPLDAAVHLLLPLSQGEQARLDSAIALRWSGYSHSLQHLWLPMLVTWELEFGHNTDFCGSWDVIDTSFSAFLVGRFWT
ncbi:hypothetical protein KTAU_11460 [Thermogemmatispora aurantia]|uniref:Uncharacterized protein n=1 Tax=Thermogemmatispora aurantia TaxID=2045279 RepID=A0A5J4K738_9CHLR|nr:hypothetical protein KTAU_11460 [Thermogemmatispora aurantia]